VLPLQPKLSSIEALHSAPLCPLCGCCRAIFPADATGSAYSCYSCIFVRGLRIRPPNEVSKELNAVGDDIGKSRELVDAVQSLKIVSHAIQREEPFSLSSDIPEVDTTYQFRSLPMRKAAAALAKIKGGPPQIPVWGEAPVLRHIEGLVRQGLEEQERSLQHLMREFTAVGLLEDIGKLPEAFLCPRARQLSLNEWGA